MADNMITICGTLGRDPELRFTNGGSATAGCGVAVNRRWQKNNEWQEETTWINVVAWAQLAENFAASCSKGDRVTVTGRLAIRSYEAKEGGTKYITEIVADDIGLSLKWATGSVERTERKSSNSGDGYKNADAAAKGLADAGLTYDESEPF